MIEVDLHSHSINSFCGNHTMLELLDFARKKGLKALAITDHGPLLGQKITSTFFERFQNPYDDIVFFKGMEGNLAKEKGEIDIPKRFLKHLDIVLLGIHPNTPKKLEKEYYTDFLVSAMANNPFVDVITHPNDPSYPVDYDTVIKTAKKLGMLIELNNSKNLYNITTEELTKSLIQKCIEFECPVLVSSDAHTVHELGDDSAIRPYLEEMNFPEELIINSNLEKATAFIQERKKLKSI